MSPYKRAEGVELNTEQLEINVKLYDTQKNKLLSFKKKLCEKTQFQGLADP